MSSKIAVRRTLARKQCRPSLKRHSVVTRETYRYQLSELTDGFVMMLA
jgi:hypothetical protein